METVIGIALIGGLLKFLLSRPPQRAWTNEQIAMHNQMMAMRNGPGNSLGSTTPPLAEINSTK